MPPGIISESLHLILYEKEFYVYQLPTDAPIPSQILSALATPSSFVSVTRTLDEISIVTDFTLSGIEQLKGEGDKPWRSIKIKGPMDFGEFITSDY